MSKNNQRAIPGGSKRYNATKDTRCPCGRPGIRWTGNCWGCERCLRIEAMLKFENQGHRKNALAILHLGSFKDEMSAAAAYSDAAKELFGEFARTNSPG